VFTLPERTLIAVSAISSLVLPVSMHVEQVPCGSDRFCSTDAPRWQVCGCTAVIRRVDDRYDRFSAIATEIRQRRTISGRE
jgi:hypothetical protein